jgi:hypothetical protein
MNNEMYNLNNPIQGNEEQINYEKNLKLHYDTFIGVGEKTNLPLCSEFIKFIFVSEDNSKINEMIDKILSTSKSEIFHKTEMYRLYMSFYKNNNEDLLRIKKQIGFENNLIQDEIKKIEINNDELLREVKIVTKEKIELINETNLIEDEMSKYKVKFFKKFIRKNFYIFYKFIFKAFRRNSYSNSKPKSNISQSL